MLDYIEPLGSVIRNLGIGCYVAIINGLGCRVPKFFVFRY